MHPLPTLLLRNLDFVQDCLLPELRARRQTTTTILGRDLYYSGRQILNYLKALQTAGQVEYIRGKRMWRAVSKSLPGEL
jgi:hypothetical protein